MPEFLIVGAGAAGLAAAQVFAAKSVDFLVLEAGQQVGGRVLSKSAGPGRVVDLGAQFLNLDMTELNAVAGMCGILPRLREPSNGSTAFVSSQKNYDAASVLDQVDQGFYQLKTKGIELKSGSTAEDLISVLKLDDQAKLLMASILEEIFCMSPGSVNGPAFLETLKKYNSNQSDDCMWFPSGMGNLLKSWAKPLAHHIMFGKLVTHIEVEANGVRAWCKNEVFKANHVILAISPVVLRNIVFFPSFPHNIRLAHLAFRSGTALKASLRFAAPFWEDAGYNGDIYGYELAGVLALNTSVPEADDFTISMHVTGRSANDLFKGRGLQDALLAILRSAWGAAPPELISLKTRLWDASNCVAGGYNAQIERGAPNGVVATLRAGMPNITFASSEIAPEFSGFVEGALRRGLEAGKVALASRGYRHL